MEGSFGFHDYEEQKARQYAREFERMLREDDYGFLDLVEVDHIYQYYLRSNDLRKAEKLIGYALETHPNNADLNHKQAQLLAEQGFYARAIDHINLARQLAPSEWEYLHVHADILTQAEQYDMAIELLQDHLAESQYPEELLLQMGNIAQIARNATESEAFYSESLRINPAFEDALYELAFLLEAEDRWQEAVEQYLSFLDRYPYRAGVWFQLGNLYRKLGNYEKGLEAYDYALVVDEDFSPAFFSKGQALMEMDRYQEALRAFLSSVSHNDKDLPAVYHAAECFERLNMYKDAIRYYKKAGTLDPDYLDAWTGLGYCLEKCDQYTEAIHFYQKAFRLEDENPDLCLSLAICEYKLENRHGAYLYLQRALQLAPEEVTLWQDWAQLLYESQNFLGAVTYLEEGIKRNAQATELYYQCAAYAYEAGLREKGLLYLENALLLDFDGHYLLFHIDPSLRYEPSVMSVIEQYR